MALKRSVVLVLSALLFLAGGVRGAESDYDPEGEFSRYRSFAWAEQDGARPGRRQGLDRPMWSPIADKHLRDAVESELTERGLERAPSPLAADLLVVFHLGKDIEKSVSWYRTGPYHRRWRRSVRTYREGVLTIDLVDRDRRELVWRGWEDAVLKEDPDKRAAQVEKLVHKILKQYPPGK